MADRAGRTAVIAASFGVQALIFALVAGYAAQQGASHQGTSQASIMNGPMVISMSIEGQNGTARIPNLVTGLVFPTNSPEATTGSPEATTVVLGNKPQFTVQPDMDTTMRILVNLPAGYPADGFTFEIVQELGLGWLSTPDSEYPTLTVGQLGPGSHDYGFRWPGRSMVRGGWDLVMSMKWRGTTTNVAIAEIGT